MMAYTIPSPWSTTQTAHNDACVEAIMQHHGDLTAGEAANFAGISCLQAIQSMRRLCDLGVIELREPRLCEQDGRRVAAFILAPDRWARER